MAGGRHGASPSAAQPVPSLSPSLFCLHLWVSLSPWVSVPPSLGLSLSLVAFSLPGFFFSGSLSLSGLSLCLSFSLSLVCLSLCVSDSLSRGLWPPVSHPRHHKCSVFLLLYPGRWGRWPGTPWYCVGRGVSQPAVLRCCAPSSHMDNKTKIGFESGSALRFEGK